MSLLLLGSFFLVIVFGAAAEYRQHTAEKALQAGTAAIVSATGVVAAQAFNSQRSEYYDHRMQTFEERLKEFRDELWDQRKTAIEQTAAASRERNIIIGFLFANLVMIILNLFWRSHDRQRGGSSST
jgi:hypothetical protein